MRGVEGLVAAAAERPANAYLLTGGDDATRAAAVELAAALAGDDTGRTLRGTHPDVDVFGPAGASGYLAAQIDGDLRTQAYRAPLEGRRRVVVVDRADLLGPLLESALLKTLEEPPAATSFVLSCSDAAGVGDTIVSRCVHLAVPPMPPAEAGERLAAECGVDAAEAERLVAATGSVDTARMLLTDGDEAQRRLRWLRVPERLRDAPATALAREVLADFDDALAAQAERQRAERDDLDAHIGGAKASVRGSRGIVKALEDRHQREQRWHTTALVRRFVATLSCFLRDVVAAGVGAGVLGTEVEASVRSVAASIGAAGALRGLTRLGRLEADLEYNPNPDLVVEAILVDLRALLLDEV